jgi:hypothetical protein
MSDEGSARQHRCRTHRSTHLAAPSTHGRWLQAGQLEATHCAVRARRAVAQRCSGRAIRGALLLLLLLLLCTAVMNA